MVSKTSWHDFKQLDFKNKTWGFRQSELFVKVNFEILQKVLNRCGQYLSRIDFSRAIGLRSEILSGVAHYCPNIKCILIPEIDVAPWTLKVLAEKCSKIVSFTIGDTTDACEDELSVLFEKNQHLKRVKFVFNPKVTGNCLKKLNAEKIKSIIFDHCRSILFKNFNVSIV